MLVMLYCQGHDLLATLAEGSLFALTPEPMVASLAEGSILCSPSQGECGLRLRKKSTRSGLTEPMLATLAGRENFVPRTL